MTHDVIRHLLDDYVTGELPEDARVPVAEHVAACAICAEEVRGLERVLARAADLPKSIDPPPEAWANIKAAIQRDEASVAAPAGQRFASRHPVLIALAASIVVAILSSAGTVAYLHSRAATTQSVAGAGDQSTPASFAAFTIEENNYLRTAGALQDILDQQESVLAPETVAQLRASLRTIDEAILEARNALARDPANKVLIEMLSANYRQKVDLLRRTTEMTRGS
ncbi:MAG TPA: zf-HC2 domain-containing protein [Gemmatimonadaceae bacterium]|nr:zf-HC2 domain-containing protein [Gemmatimonadaceae bacterium]